MQVTIDDLINLMSIFNGCPRWLPIPDELPTIMNVTHKEYQEVYSRGIQVAISKAHIEKALGKYQVGLEQRQVKEYYKWEGGQAPITLGVVPQEELDRYSLKVLHNLQSCPRY